MTLFSVILPVYQGEETILQSILSVLHQTEHQLELIVVDDGSTDKTWDILSQINDPRVRLFRKANQGVAAARNTGIEQANGEYIAFLDADDRWLPEKLATDRAVLASHHWPIGLVYSGYYGVNAKDQLVNVSPLYDDNGLIFSTVLTQESVLLPSTTTLHRQIFHKLGGFPTEAYHEDRAFFLKVCKYFPAYPTQKRTVLYRQSLSGRCRRVLQDFDQAVAAESSVLGTLHPYLSPTEMNQLASVQTVQLLYRFLMYGFLPSAKKLFRRMRLEEMDMTLLAHNRKGLLTLMSLWTGINFLQLARQIVQSCFSVMTPMKEGKRCTSLIFTT